MKSLTVVAAVQRLCTAAEAGWVQGTVASLLGLRPNVVRHFRATPEW